MKIIVNKNGVALILTISLISVLSILGISFIFLLEQDQKIAKNQFDYMNADVAIEAAVNAGIWEIKKQLETKPNYFYSEIESAAPDGASVNESPIYFKNIIRATNAQVCLYQNSPEISNIMDKLAGNIGLTDPVRDDLRALYRILRVYHSNWDMKSISEFMKIDKAGIGDATKAKIYSALADKVTVYPKDKVGELIVNIIDYGRCLVIADANKLKADKRDFAPSLNYNTIPYIFTSDKFALRGAKVRIISGTGKGQSRDILEVDMSSPDTLILSDNWNPLPDNTSIYRIYAYVSPINFNAAPVEVIKSNLEVMEPVVRKLHSGNGFPLASYISNISSDFLPQLWDLRENLNYSVIDFSDFDKKYISKISGFNGDVLIKNALLAQLDPTRPKGIYDGGVWKIFPLPVPFCFESACYYDMEIKAGLKRDPKNAKAGYTINKFVTVKIGGMKEQTLREDFEKHRYQHWVTSNDFTPVRNMADFANWKAVYSTNFNANNIVYNYTESENVIPDSVKTGLYFDFTKMTDGKVFSMEDSVTPKFKNIDDFLSSDFYKDPATSDAQLTGGRLKIEGTSNTEPEVKVTLGNTSAYDFGDIGVMYELNDENPLGDSNNRFPHPLASTGWFTGVLAGHSWSDHTGTSDKDINGIAFKSYPPRRYFTPTFFIKYDNTIDKAIEVRAEQMFDDQTDAAACTISGGDYTSSVDFSISQQGGDWDKRFLHDPGESAYSYINKYRVFIGASIKPHEFIWLNANTDNDVDIELNENSLTNDGKILHNIYYDASSHKIPFQFVNFELLGKLGFKRDFSSEYYADDNTRSFGVKYLRIISGNAGNNDNDNSYFISDKIDLPENVNSYKKARVYYKIGVRENTTNLNDVFNVGVDSIRIKLKIQLDKSPEDPYSAFIADKEKETGDIDINSFEKTIGFVDFDFNSASKVADQCSYKIIIKNSSNDKEKSLAFLRSTIAITKVEIYFDTGTIVYKVSDER